MTEPLQRSDNRQHFGQTRSAVSVRAGKLSVCRKFYKTCTIELLAFSFCGGCKYASLAMQFVSLSLPPCIWMSLSFLRKYLPASQSVTDSAGCASATQEQVGEF